MNKIDELKNNLTQQQMLITDPMSIRYYTQSTYHCGERMLVLLVQKDQSPILFLNRLFQPHKTIQTLSFDDSQNPLALLADFLIQDQTIAIDGFWPSRFLLPMIEKGYRFKDESNLIEKQRSRKSTEEILLLKEASRHNDRIMAELMEHLIPGISEKELADIIRHKQSQVPLSGVSFEPIVCFGEGSADPHWTPGSRTLSAYDSVLIDMGGIYQGYCSDMTRCFFMDEHHELKPIYDIVLQANRAALAAIKVGVPLAAIDEAARSVIRSHGYGEAFVHRTGHGIGIECHEPLDVSSSNPTLIEPGMCFSIEPGIYLPKIGGIRIEDLVCVGENGIDILNSFEK